MIFLYLRYPRSYSCFESYFSEHLGSSRLRLLLLYSFITRLYMSRLCFSLPPVFWCYFFCNKNLKSAVSDNFTHNLFNQKHRWEVGLWFWKQTLTLNSLWWSFNSIHELESRISSVRGTQIYDLKTELQKQKYTQAINNYNIGDFCVKQYFVKNCQVLPMSISIDIYSQRSNQHDTIHLHKRCRY